MTRKQRKPVNTAAQVAALKAEKKKYAVRIDEIPQARFRDDALEHLFDRRVANHERKALPHRKRDRARCARLHLYAYVRQPPDLLQHLQQRPTGHAK